MPIRSRVIKTIAITGLLAGGFLAILPVSVWQQPSEELERTAASTIVAAIDSGASSALAGLLPTSEAYERGTIVVSGLKSAVPGAAGSLSLAQLDVVASTARGAVGAVTTTNPGTMLGAPAKDALRATARGTIRATLENMPPSPSSGTSAILESLVGGAFEGAVASLQNGALASASQQESWSYEFATEAYAWTNDQSAGAVAIVGSPALGDIHDYTSTITRTQLDNFPIDASAQQIDALASFAGGEASGFAAGIVRDFPRGLSSASRDSIASLAAGLAQGGPLPIRPWDFATDGAVNLLAAWGREVADASVHALATGAPSAPSQAALADLEAWGEGLADAGYQSLRGAPADSQYLRQDVRAYAQALATSGIHAIRDAPNVNADPDAVRAYATGLGAGLSDLAGAATAPAALLDQYLSGLAFAIRATPSDVTPEQVLIFQAFAEGATTRIEPRLAAVQAAAVGDEDPELLDAMVKGLVDGGLALVAGDVPAADPAAVKSLTDGLALGFLDTLDPAFVWSDADGLTAATSAWFGAIIPSATFGPLAATGEQAVRDPAAGINKFGQSAGAAPVEWAAKKGQGISAEAFATKADLVWVVTLAAEAANKTLQPIVTPGLHTPDIDAYQSAISAYVRAVTSNATALPIAAALASVNDSDLQGYSTGFARALLEPIDWIHAPTLDDSTQAANATLQVLLDPEANIEKFVKPQYATTLLQLMNAVDAGIWRAADIANKTPAGAGLQAELLAAWVNGSMQSILDVPTDSLHQDVNDRALWLTSATMSATTAISNASLAQARATSEYAENVTAFILNLPDRDLPDFSAFQTPLLTWANATVQPALEHFPPGASDEERGAYVAYATGVAESVANLPTPDAIAWTAPQIAAMFAYVHGVSAGVDTVKADLADITHTVQCNVKGPAKPADCPTAPPPPPQEPSTCDDSCQTSAQSNATQRYVDNLHNWSLRVVSAGLADLPSTSPTEDGIVAISAWSHGILAGAGLEVNTTAPGLDYQGPRGPAFDFAWARKSQVAAFAQSAATGFGVLATIDGLDHRSAANDTTALADPLQRWAAAIQNASAGYFLDPARQPVVAPPTAQPHLPPEPPADPTQDDGANAWVSAVWDVVPLAYQDVVGTTLPQTPFAQQYADQLDYVAWTAITRGGMEGALESEQAATRTGAAYSPQTGPLPAFALGLIRGAQSSLVDPTIADSTQLSSYMTGIAEGGVAAITQLGTNAQEQQLPAIVAYATVISNPDWIPGAPLPIESHGGSDEGGGEDPDPGEDEASSPSSLDVLTAHAQALGAAVVNVPASSLLDGTNTSVSYAESVLSAVAALRDSGRILPPASVDAGYVARLQEWEARELAGALAPASLVAPDRLAPAPDGALARAFVENFAGSSAWELISQTRAQTSARASWAQAAVRAIANQHCPSLDAQTCAAIGGALGDALASVVPLLPPGDVGDQTALLQSTIAGVLAGVNPADPAGLPSVVGGTLQGVLPGGVGQPNAEGIARAASDASSGLPLPPEAQAILAEAITSALRSANEGDAERAAALAEGAAGHVLSNVPVGSPAEPAQITALVYQFIAPGQSPGGNESNKTDDNSTTTAPPPPSATPKPSVSVSDGRRTLREADLNGSAYLDGLLNVTMGLVPAASSTSSSWSVVWNGNTLALANKSGRWTAVLPATSGEIRFHVVEGDIAHNASYAFQLDDDRPTAVVSSPPTSANATFVVSWAGSDSASGVATFAVQAKDGSAGWRSVATATRDTSVNYSGQGGHSYSFRVAATDNVGHTGNWSAESKTEVARGASANNVPVIRFLSPENDSSYNSSILAIVEAIDADGSPPFLHVCVTRAETNESLSCPYEGSATSFRVDVAELPDGNLRLWASADDGMHVTEALSAIFTLDRVPPVVRGVTIESVEPEATMSVGASDDARAVFVVVKDESGKTAASKDLVKGKNGIWSVSTPLAAGDYSFLVTAKDAAGNQASATKALRVPAPGEVLPTDAPSTEPEASATAVEQSAPPTMGWLIVASIAGVVGAVAVVAWALKRRHV